MKKGLRRQNLAVWNSERDQMRMRQKRKEKENVEEEK